MNNTKTSPFARIPLIALAALPLTVGLVFAQQSSAGSAAQAPQRVQPAQPGQRAPGPQNQPGSMPQPSGTNYSDVFIKNLAAQLGVSVDRLKAAALAASKSTLDQGVKAGDFPAQMAQSMSQRLQDHPFALAGGRGMRGPGGDRPGGERGEFGGRGGPDFQGGQPGQGGPAGDLRQGRPGAIGQAVNAAVAKALGLTDQQLMTELQGGKTVAQLAQARGVSVAALHTAAVNALKAGLAADVKAGRLTQAQADELLGRAQADPNFGLNFGGRGHGGPRGDSNNGTDNGTTSSGASGNT